MKTSENLVLMNLYASFVSIPENLIKLALPNSCNLLMITLNFLIFSSVGFPKTGEIGRMQLFTVKDMNQVVSILGKIIEIFIKYFLLILQKDVE